MYKVYIQNSLLTIGDKPHGKPDWHLDYYNHIPFDLLINQLEHSPVSLNYHIRTQSNEAEIWKEFTKHFEIIRAAGGIVRNSNGELLIIRRHGKFDLPKGKVEEFENLKDAALREVAEECGIRQNLFVDGEPTTSYHTYLIDNHRILKETHWFPMIYQESHYTFKPQTEEGITEVFWLKTEMISKIYSNTYPNIKDLLQHYSTIK